MAQDVTQKIFELKGQGLSERKIADKLGIKRYDVRKVVENPEKASTNQPTNQLTSGSTGSTMSTTTRTPIPPRTAMEKTELPDIVEKEMLLQATPIIRKVMLNPKVYLWYDYARSKLGFEGDIGDFLLDTVEDFWKSRGYTIKISQEEEI